MIMSNAIIMSFLGQKPQIDKAVFVASGAVVVGDVAIKKESSIWFNVSCRGDVHHIRIGSGTNIQDNSVIHVTNNLFPTQIGNLVTIGHNAIIHGCTIADEVLVGMGAIVLDGAVIPKHCIVAAGSLVPSHKTYPPGSLLMGTPAKVSRMLSRKEVDSILISAKHYMTLSEQYGANGSSF